MAPFPEKRLDCSSIEFAWSRGIGVKVQRGYLLDVDKVAFASASNFRDFMVQGEIHGLWPALVWPDGL